VAFNVQFFAGPTTHRGKEADCIQFVPEGKVSHVNAYYPGGKGMRISARGKRVSRK